MKEIRCKSCGRYLGEMSYGEVNFKCAKCGTVNKFKVTSYTFELNKPKIVEYNKT